MNDAIRVLVVDDTVVYRKVVSDVLAEIDGIEVVGIAANGKIAMQKLELLKPDIITLDVEMPEMNGLEVLRKLQGASHQPGVIMLSAFTAEGAQSTMEALNLGAFDFVLKPSSSSIEQSKEILKQELAPKILACARKQNISVVLSGKSDVAGTTTTVTPAQSPKVSNKTPLVVPQTKMSGSPKVVALGISTGGPQALNRMLPKLPADLEVPVLIVQHMPAIFTQSLANDLDSKCALQVSEAQNGEKVLPGHIYIAPGGQQMKVVKSGLDIQIAITDDPPENSCKPSVDYLFRSVYHVYGGNVVGVIMTGMGYDGALGCRLLKRKGAYIITQDEATSVVYGMPEQPAREGLSDAITPLDDIAGTIVDYVRRGALLCK